MCHQANVGLEGGHQGRTRALGGPPWVQFRWAASCYLLDLAHGRYLRSWVGLVLVWDSSSLVWPWILFMIGALSLPLEWICVYAFPVAHFDSFYMYFRYVSCKCTTYQNSWNSLVWILFTKFLYFFSCKVGG
jgi:hypothetical protein